MKIQAMKNRKFVGLKIEDIAYQKMMCYTNSVKTEIGWLGTATREGSIFTIHDVFLLNQEVHGATAELTTDGISKLLYDELSVRKDYTSLLSNMKVWGHSHNTMTVDPSKQDEMQMEIFEDGGYDFMIRLITNHEGEIGVTIYDYVTGIIYNDVDWHVVYDENIYSTLKSAEKQLNYYQNLVERIKYNSKINEDEIKKEIKEKVKEKKVGYAWSGKKKTKDEHYRDWREQMDYIEEDYFYNPYSKIDDYIDYEKAIDDGLVDINEEGDVVWID